MPLYKDGDPETVTNYRGIALGSCVAKVLAKLLSRRLGTFAEDTSVEDFIKVWKQVWCWKGNSQDGFRLKQGYAKVARCHRCYTAYT